MKKKFTYMFFIIIFTFFLLSSNYNVKCFAEDNNLELYKGTIYHAFTHCLLAFPEIALNHQNPMRTDYDRDCITKNEFKQILAQLYKNNYILININDVFFKKNNQCYKKSIYLPKGKKPLILSFDDVNYDTKKLGKGMVDKLILDKHNNVISKTIVNGKIIESDDNEFVPILDKFILTHPDFSFNGAKGMICLTGYDGILGYRTQAKNNINRESEIQNCKKVVTRLKETGWTFACHSFGHYHMKKISEEKFRDEIDRWNNEVVPLIGKTSIYVYPYGEWEILNNDKTALSNKHKMLIENDFKMFCGVGIKPFFSSLPYNWDQSEQILFMDRCPIDGNTLKNRGKDLNYLFPSKSVYDYKFR